MVDKRHNKEDECFLTPIEIGIVSAEIEKISDTLPSDIADIIKENKKTIIKAVNVYKKGHLL